MNLSLSSLSEYVVARLMAKGYTDIGNIKVELERHPCGQYKLWFYTDASRTGPIQQCSVLSDYFSIENFADAEYDFLTRVFEKLDELPTCKESLMKELMNAMEKARELSDDLDLPDEFRAQIQESITSLSTNILEKK